MPMGRFHPLDVAYELSRLGPHEPKCNYVVCFLVRLSPLYGVAWLMSSPLSADRPPPPRRAGSIQPGVRPTGNGWRGGGGGGGMPAGWWMYVGGAEDNRAGGILLVVANDEH